MGTANPHAIAKCGRRAHSRLRVGVAVHLITLHGQGPALLENVSATGARIASRFALRPGMSCVLQLPGLELFADVTWASQDRCGLIFERPLSQRQLLALRQLDRPTAGGLTERQAWARDFVNGTGGSGA